MFSRGEIKGFSKSCNLRSSSNLFMNVMQYPGPSDLPYGIVPGVPRSDGSLRLFLVFTFIWQENAVKIPKVPGAPRNVNPARATTWLVGLTNNQLGHQFNF